MTEVADQSAEAEVEAVADAVEVEAEVEAPEAQLDDDGNPIEDEADDTEYDDWADDRGRTYKVPKALKEAELRQADYTRKTQEVAAERKAIAAERETAAKLLELQRSVIAEQAELKAIEKSEAEWRAFKPRSPEEADERRERLDDLRIEREQTAQAMHTKAYQASQQAQHHDAKALADMRSELPKLIPGFTPDLETKIAQFAVADLGIPAEEISAIRNPKFVKVLHLAMLGAKASTAQATAAKQSQAQKTKPVPTLRGSAGRFTAPADTSDFAAFERLADAKLSKG